MLKGALHCHTTRSDGEGSPEDVIRLHAKHGYAFMALTDHNRYNYENFAPDTDMLIVPGAEIGWGIYGGDHHYFHAVTIGPTREDGNGFAQNHLFESGNVSDQFQFQRVLNGLHQNENMTIHCHPEWSCTPARDFERLTGNFAMEIWNTGCATENEMDTDAAYWDELLMQGIRIYGVATDDGHAMAHHCKGWVMVNAHRNLNAILGALKAGAFYASCGPEIRDFYVDGGVAVVECSHCSRIEFFYGRHPTRVIRAKGSPLMRGEWKLPEWFRYVRAAVVDEAGRKAWTNPIFFDI